MSNFLSADYEPVRRWLYGIALAIIAGAVGFRLLTGEQGAAIGAIVTAVLLVPTAELVRTKTKAYKTVAAGKDENGVVRSGPAAAPLFTVGAPVEVTPAGPSPYGPGGYVIDDSPDL